MDMLIKRFEFESILQYTRLFLSLLVLVVAIMALITLLSKVNIMASIIVLAASMFAFSRVIAYLKNRLKIILIVKPEGIEISSPENLSIFNIKRKQQEYKWNEIVSIGIADKNEGTIALKTKEQTYSFCYPYEMKKNNEVVALINSYLRK